MPISRPNAVSYLVGMYGSGANNLLALADVAVTDTVGGLKEPIDEAALLLGVSYDELGSLSVLSSDASGFLAALRYTTIKRVLAGLNQKVLMGDASAGGGVGLKIKEWRDDLEVQLKIAAEEAANFGIDVAGSSGGWGSMSNSAGPLGIYLDYLDPVEVPIA